MYGLKLPSRSRANQAGLIVSLGLLTLSLALSACDTVPSAGGSVIVPRGTGFLVNATGPMDVKATCRKGEQLLGGAYSLAQPSVGGPSAGSPTWNQLIVLGSYPSAINEWTVRIYNPDTDPKGLNMGNWVEAIAYCVVAPRFSVAMQTATSKASTPSYASNPTLINVKCPVGSIVTGGGFATEFTTAIAGQYDSWLYVSAPSLDALGQADGWRVVEENWSVGPSTATSAYVLCAAKNLVSATPVSYRISENSPYYFGDWKGQAECPSGQFSSAGGYEFVGDRLVPHLVYSNAAIPNLSGWSAKGIHGHQRNAVGEIVVWAICINTPTIDLTVQISSPLDGSHIPTLGVHPTSQCPTRPVTFAATAYDGAGKAVSATLKWTDNGQPLGNGSPFSSTLNASPCGPASHLIAVVATDSAGHTASDSVTVLAQY